MNKKGFTKVELLVAASIIGVLGIIAAVAISGARSQTRDAVRLSDVRQVQAGLELFFNDFSEYPESFTAIALGSASASCLGESGFDANCNPLTETVYSEVIGMTPADGLRRLVRCGDESNAYCYTGSGSEYRIQFELEQAQPLLDLDAGINCATEDGFETGACLALVNQPPAEQPEE